MGITELRKELEDYKRLYAEAILVRDKDYMQMFKERSDLLRLTDELREAMNYHKKRIEDYDKKIKEVSARPSKV